MPQKNLTQLKLDALDAFADVLRASADELEKIREKANDLEVDHLEVANFANATEAVRRVQVFVSSADQALFGKRVDDSTMCFLQV